MDEHYLFTGYNAEQALTELATLMPQNTHAMAQYAEVSDDSSATGTSTLVLVSGDEQAFGALVAHRNDFTLIPAMTADEEEGSDEAWAVRERRYLFGRKHAPQMVHLAAPTFTHDAPMQTGARTSFSAERRFDVPPGHYLLSYLPRSTWFEVRDVLVSVSEGRPVESLSTRRFTVHGWGVRTPHIDSRSAYFTGHLDNASAPDLPEWVNELVSIVAADVDRLLELTGPAHQ